MKSDAQLKNEVARELEWEPAVNAANVGVAVRHGVVTLRGHLDTCAEKLAIERAVQRVRGVRALAIKLDVELSPRHKRSDSEIAAAAEAALKWHSEIPPDRIKVSVDNGRIHLKGELDWEYQRNAAVRAVEALVGVVRVQNSIALKAHLIPADIGTPIREALERQAQDASDRIEVVVSGASVILRGTVHSWAARAAAQGAAWSSPGISNVVNELRVAG